MNRNQQILAAVLVSQVVLSIIIFWPKAATSRIEPLVSDLEVEDIVSMTVTDADGKMIEVRKVTGNWVLPSADDYPAKADKITPVLDKIKDLTTRSLVTRTSASHKRLQVAPDDFLWRVDLEMADGAKHTLYLGSSPSYGTCHVRGEGKNETYLSSDLSPWDLGSTAVSWVDASYFAFPQDELTQVTLENANGTFTFTKDAEGAWTLTGLAAGEELSSDKVNTVVNKAASVTLTTPLGKEKLTAYGLDNPAAIVTLKTEEQTVTLLVGAQDPDDKSYVVHVSTSPYYVRVAEYSVKPLVENARSDFLQPTPTPSPTVQSSTS